MSVNELRNKVIQGLMCCSYLEHPNCGECPQDGPGFGFACRDGLIKSALALLLAQEPHVIDGNCLIWDDRRTVWLETRHDGMIEPVKCHGMRGKLWFFSAYTGGKCFAAIGEDYGKTWRCWTAEPTEEQRKAVAWE